MHAQLLGCAIYMAITGCQLGKSELVFCPCFHCIGLNLLQHDLLLLMRPYKILVTTGPNTVDIADMHVIMSTMLAM